MHILHILSQKILKILKTWKVLELCLDVRSSLKQKSVPTQIFDHVAHILYKEKNVQIFGIF